MFVLNGNKIKYDLAAYKPTQLSKLTIDNNDPVVKQLEQSNDLGLKYLRQINGKNDVESWLNANGDTLLNGIVMGGGLLATILTGGAAAPIIPAASAASGLISQQTGLQKNEKQILTETSQKIKQFELLNAPTEIANKISSTNIVVLGVAGFLVIALSFFLLFRK